MIPTRHLTHDPFRLGSTAKAFPPVAASFWLDARLVRDLSSAYLRGTKNLPSDFCHPKTLYPNLHPCSRRPKKHSDSHPTSSRDPSVHADRARFGGTTRARARYSLASLAAIFASDASVAVPARPLGLSTERGSPDPPKMISTRAAVTQTRASTTRDAFHRCRFERRRSAVFAGSGEVTARAETTRLEPRERGRLRRLARRELPFATRGSSSSEDAREVFPLWLAPACSCPSS